MLARSEDEDEVRRRETEFEAEMKTGSETE